LSSSVLIVGSGPAAAGAALAATDDPEVTVTVIDIGGRLDPAHEEARRRLSQAAPGDWAEDDLATISLQPVPTEVEGLPEKRAYGSDYPFRDFGQRRSIVAAGLNPAIVSGAYGGFSNAWGAQFMPFTEATFRDWPVTGSEMQRHYRAVLAAVPLAAEEDDLAGMFPLLKEAAAPLPTLSDRSASTLSRYAQHRDSLGRAGILMGRARLAFDAADCVRCGLCMTGCPYSLIYSAGQTITELGDSGRISYLGGLIALEVEEDEGSATVVAKEIDGGRIRRFTADRVLLAAGAIGTSRLVMASRRLYGIPMPVHESRQFRLPFLSARPTADPRGRRDFTLNQFNMVIKHDDDALDVSQLHFYTYNPAFLEALPRALRGPRAGAIRKALLRRLTVALGYLPSWASPTFSLRVDRAADAGEPAALTLGSVAGEMPSLRNTMLREVVRSLSLAAPKLDLWPILPALRMSAGGKSYHWGGIFPHSESGASESTTDALGRVGDWRRIHLVDSSVFPNVPATTFALTVMANSHRIAEAALRGPDR
jgi:choline dehydrogenase-like flavoprotein